MAAAAAAALALFALSMHSGAASAADALLMYHHVSPVVLPGPFARALTLTPGEFEQQLRWLRGHGCAALSVMELRATESTTTACAAALTFDDGYDDSVRYALPLLQRYGAHATFYVTSGFVGKPGHVSRNDLLMLLRAGMEIGAHTVHHDDLTQLPVPTAAQEIDASRSALHAWTGARISTFAYPSGRENVAVVRAVRAAGFSNAVTTIPGVLRPGSDPYRLPRYRMERGHGLALLAAVFGGPALGRAATQRGYDRALHNVARRRIAGNDPRTAEAVAVALLSRRFAEQILKVHVLAIPAARVAGIVLSGVKFHASMSRTRFMADVREMGKAAVAAAPALDEIDIWATVPIAALPGKPVSGDYAVPVARTVFSSAALVRRRRERSMLEWGTTFWDPHWLQHE